MVRTGYCILHPTLPQRYTADWEKLFSYLKLYKSQNSINCIFTMRNGTLHTCHQEGVWSLIQPIPIQWTTVYQNSYIYVEFRSHCIKDSLKKMHCLATPEVHTWSKVLTQGENEPSPRMWRNLQDAFQKNLERKTTEDKSGYQRAHLQDVSRGLCCEVCGVPGHTLMKKATGIPYWKLKVKLLNMNIWSQASCRSPSQL